jgi:hypothetical protein
MDLFNPDGEGKWSTQSILPLLSMVFWWGLWEGLGWSAKS